MEQKYSDFAKLAKSQNTWDAGLLLLGSKHYRQASVMFWHSVRDRIFGWLEMKGEGYDSSRKAFMIALRDPRLKNYASDIVFAYSIGTVAEWDENFVFNEENTLDFKEVCLTLLKSLE